MRHACIVTICVSSIVQVLHKFAGWVTANLDFKVTSLFDGECFGNDIRDRRMTTTDTWPIELCHRWWPWLTFKSISGAIKRFHCLYVKRYSVYPVYNVRSQLQFTMVGRHYVSNYLYCRIQSRGMLHDAERDLLAIAKFLVHNAINMLRR